jgi:esterase/lipase
VTVDETLPEGLQQVIMAITQPVNQPFSRELWVFNPAEKLAEVTIPVLIVIGKKDIQVDWQTDGPIFETVAKEHDNITLRYMENANHVLKLEPKPREQLTAADAMASYGSDDVALDPATVEAIISWLQAHL